MDDPLLVGVGAETRRVEQGTHCAFLARLFLGLHQVQQCHQQAGNAGQHGRVGHMEHQLDQSRNQVAEGRDRIVCTHGLALDLGAQRLQRVQPQQRPGHE